jgi:hypothetical protein
MRFGELNNRKGVETVKKFLILIVHYEILYNLCVGQKTHTHVCVCVYIYILTVILYIHGTSPFTLNESTAYTGRHLGLSRRSHRRLNKTA